jgi:hypothetical protein
VRSGASFELLLAANEGVFQHAGWFTEPKSVVSKTLVYEAFLACLQELRRLALLSSTTAWCGRVRHRYGFPSPLYIPDGWLLSALERLGMRLEATIEGKIHYAPRDLVDATTLAEIRRHKDELREILGGGGMVGPNDIDGASNDAEIDIVRTKKHSFAGETTRRNDINGINDTVRANPPVATESEETEEGKNNTDNIVKGKTKCLQIEGFCS